VFSRHVYIDYVKFDLDFIVSRLFAYFTINLSAVILDYIYEFFHRFFELYFCENGHFISPVNDCDFVTQYIADYYPHHIYLPTCIPLFNTSNVSLYEAREFIEAEFIDFIATPLVECVQYFSFNEPIRVCPSNNNHLLTISRDFDWSTDLEICCDCVERKFNSIFFYFKANNVCLFNHLMIYCSVIGITILLTMFYIFRHTLTGFLMPVRMFLYIFVL
jgi:hypothetical protein